MAVALPELPGVTHRTVDVGGLSVHVAEAGRADAPPLVLLHGWPQHWWCWRRVVPLLADSYRLVMPDLRGHGWTDAPRSGYDKEQLATDLLGTLEVLGLSDVGLIGHDWGGWTGFLACMREPARFRGFLALGILPPFQPRDPARLLQVWRGWYQVALSLPVVSGAALQRTPAVVERVLRGGSVLDAFSKDDLRLYGEVLQEPSRARATVQLYRTFLLKEAAGVMAGRYRGTSLTVPTLLVGGSGDPVITPGLVHGLEEMSDALTVEVVEGVGHFLPEEAPDVVADRARALYSTVR